MTLPIRFGYDRDGQPVIYDQAGLPHRAAEVQATHDALVAHLADLGRDIRLDVQAVLQAAVDERADWLITLAEMAPADAVVPTLPTGAG